MTGTLGREVISTRQRKIAELARREPELTLTIGVTYGAFWTDGCETECTVEQRDHYPRSRVPELGTPGSVGAAGGRPPAATRPIARRRVVERASYSDLVLSSGKGRSWHEGGAGEKISPHVADCVLIRVVAWWS